MPFVEKDGVRIHFVEEGDPKDVPLVLMHWFMGSVETWYDTSWVKTLQPYFRLILIDHRGYGQSSKPHSKEAYHPKNHVSDIKLVLDSLGINRAHFMGYSMGGRIAFAIGTYIPHRVLSLVIGGMHPFTKIPTDLAERVNLLQQGMKTVLDTYKIGPQSVYHRMLKNDPKALLADTLQTQEWGGFDDQLSQFTFPVLLYVGSKDPFVDGVRQAAAILSNAQLVVFPNETHRTTFVKKTLLLPHLTRFFGKQLR